MISHHLMSFMTKKNSNDNNDFNDDNISVYTNEVLDVGFHWSKPESL